jgi:AcrR family transcriptional regulator
MGRDRVLQAAVALADADGIEGLSMRRLAQELGVEAMSLYHYFRSKNELQEAMLDVVYREFDRPDTASSGGDWRAAMRRSAISAHHSLLRHAWACGLLMQPTGIDRARLEWMNSVLGCFREAGFSAEMTHHAYHAMDSHIVGFTLWVLPYLKLRDDRSDFAADPLRYLPVSDLPHLVEHIEYHQSAEETGTSEFDFGLDLLLDGLERLRDYGSSDPPVR